MSDRQEFASDNELDAAVSSTYRAGATEIVPGHLDRVVLAAARREAGRKYTAAGLQRWLVPAAFAAVLALSLSFNLEFNQTGVVPTVNDRTGAEGSSDDGTGGDESSVYGTALNSTGDLESAVESTGERLRALDDAVSILAPGNKPESAPESAPKPALEASSGSSAAGDTGPSSSQATDAATVDRFCGAEATVSPETWWACIKVLQRSGRSDAARVELEFLEAAFPEYELAR
jgi:hypothetical protein